MPTPQPVFGLEGIVRLACGDSSGRPVWEKGLGKHESNSTQGVVESRIDGGWDYFVMLVYRWLRMCCRYGYGMNGVFALEVSRVLYRDMLLCEVKASLGDMLQKRISRVFPPCRCVAMACWNSDASFGFFSLQQRKETKHNASKTFSHISYGPMEIAICYVSNYRCGPVWVLKVQAHK